MEPGTTLESMITADASLVSSPSSIPSSSPDHPLPPCLLSHPRPPSGILQTTDLIYSGDVNTSPESSLSAKPVRNASPSPETLRILAELQTIQSTDTNNKNVPAEICQICDPVNDHKTPKLTLCEYEGCTLQATMLCQTCGVVIFCAILSCLIFNSYALLT